MACKKVSYASKSDAKRWAKKIANAHSSTAKLRVYYCREHGCYHLTSQGVKGLKKPVSV